MKRLFREQMNKHRNKNRVYFLIALGLIVLVAVVLKINYINTRPLNEAKYEQLYVQVKQEISKENYKAALSGLRKLESGTSKTDYRTYAAYADVYNYEMKKDDAKKYAQQAISAYQKDSANVDNAILLRMESYVNGLYLPNPDAKTPSYTVPKNRVEQPGFQG